MRRIGRRRTLRPRRLPALSLNGSPRQSAHCRGGDRWHERTLLPQGGGCIELAAFSRRLRVLGIDAVGGSPHCDFANEGDVTTSRSSPRWLTATPTGVILDLVGKLGDKFGSPCQVTAPNRIGMQRCWNAW